MAERRFTGAYLCHGVRVHSGAALGGAGIDACMKAALADDAGDGARTGGERALMTQATTSGHGGGGRSRRSRRHRGDARIDHFRARGRVPVERGFGATDALVVTRRCIISTAVRVEGAAARNWLPSAQAELIRKPRTPVRVCHVPSHASRRVLCELRQDGHGRSGVLGPVADFLCKPIMNYIGRTLGHHLTGADPSEAPVMGLTNIIAGISYAPQLRSCMATRSR